MAWPGLAWPDLAFLALKGLKRKEKKGKGKERPDLTSQISMRIPESKQEFARNDFLALMTSRKSERA